MQIGCRLCRRRSGLRRDKAADKMPTARRKGLESRRKTVRHTARRSNDRFGLNPKPHGRAGTRRTRHGHAGKGTPATGQRSTRKRAEESQQAGKGRLRTRLRHRRRERPGTNQARRARGRAGRRTPHGHDDKKQEERRGTNSFLTTFAKIFRIETCQGRKPVAVFVL